MVFTSSEINQIEYDSLVNPIRYIPLLEKISDKRSDLIGDHAVLF